MNILYRLCGTPELDKSKLSLTKMGISFLSLAACVLYFVFAIYFRYLRIIPLTWLCVIQTCISLALFLLCRTGRMSAYRLAYIALSIGVILWHYYLTLYFGDCGTEFIAAAAICANHLFPILKKRNIFLFDLLLVVAINAIFFLKHHYPPIAAGTISELYRHVTLNICIGICLFELFASILLQAIIDKQNENLLKESTKTASLDALTGLGNRRKLAEFEKSLQAQCAEQVPLSIAMLDIDHFKTINDTYGHTIGDTVLKALADIMHKAFRKNDTLIRWGGEEFLICLHNTTTTQAEMLMQRFQSHLSALQSEFADIKLNIQVTIGISAYQAGEPLEAAIQRADRMMYLGKDAGRNCIRVDHFSTKSSD